MKPPSSKEQETAISGRSIQSSDSILFFNAVSVPKRTSHCDWDSVRYFHSTKEPYACYYTHRYTRFCAEPPSWAALWQDALTPHQSHEHVASWKDCILPLTTWRAPVFSLFNVHISMLNSTYTHMLAAFPKSLKKSFQRVLARDRVPVGLQHQTLGLYDAGQMEQTASIQTDKKGILCSISCKGCMGYQHSSGPWKLAHSQLWQRGKKLSYECSSLEVFLLADGYKEIRQLWAG